MQATRGRDLRPIASAAVRTVIFIAIAVALIFVLLPAALAGAAN